MLNHEFQNTFAIYFKAFLRRKALTVSIPSISNDHNIHFQLKIEHFKVMQSVPDIPSISMEKHYSLVSLWVSLLNEPPFEHQVVACEDGNFIEGHVTLSRVSEGLWVVFWESESLVRSVRNVEQPV